MRKEAWRTRHELSPAWQETATEEERARVVGKVSTGLSCIGIGQPFVPPFLTCNSIGQQTKCARVRDTRDTTAGEAESEVFHS